MIRCPGCGEENPPKFRLCGYCGTPLAGAAPAPPALPVREVRKTVTLLFCDLKGSTALGESLDAEALHEVKERYFASMSAAIARHGGRVEKYIGDAIMAVFGLPRAREDDALRAVRAAAEMQSALQGVNQVLGERYGVQLANRTGINTGEVVTSDDPNAEQKLATGDAVNVAARLEQAAPDNEVYLGEATWQLVRDAVALEPVEPLALKGKAQPIPAWRLAGVPQMDGPARRADTPLVGRDAELAAIEAARDDALARHAAALVTVIGEAGMGKSRLVQEATQRCGPNARLLRGRCLPYGDGITFWPLRMMVREAADIAETDDTAQALEKLQRAAGSEAVAERLAAAVGFREGSWPMAEILWAARRFLEQVAGKGLLVVIVDDLHWAEPAFTALLEHLRASMIRPLLLLVTARPELADEHPDWGAGAPRLVLQPLSEASTTRVVEHLLGSAGLAPELIRRIGTAAEGNPLYVEQMLSMMVESGALVRDGDAWTMAADAAGLSVPPTIHALLEARLDALQRPERATVDTASVVGLEFPRAALSALAPTAIRDTLEVQLGSLVRQRLIRLGADEDRSTVYRFHHHLVRETAYGSLLKRTRAQLHVEFVRWADRANAESDRALEFEAILGYHLEQAHRYLGELGPLDAEGQAIGVDASDRLARAGRRAFALGDLDAAANLLGRAAALRPTGDPQQLSLRMEWGEVLMELGRFDEARECLDAVVAEAGPRGAARVEASARLLRYRVRIFSAEPGDWGDETLAAAQAAIPLLEREQADADLARAWRLIGFIHGVAGRYGRSTEAVTQSMKHARRAGDERLVARNAMGLAVSALLGPTPVDEALAQCEAVLAQRPRDRQAEAKILGTLAQLHAMRGEFDPARRCVREARALLSDLGQNVAAASTAIDLMAVEFLAGDLALAEREARADHDFLAAAGETYLLSTIAALLSRVVRDQGRDDEAMVFSEAAEAASADDDVESQASWRSVRAPILARRGDLAAAETLARSAVELARRTDGLSLQADTLAELATVMHVAGRAADARSTVEEAIAIYRAKGDRVSSARWAAWAARIS